jgi:hypothetical protein
MLTRGTAQRQRLPNNEGKLIGCVARAPAMPLAGQEQ